MKKDATYLQYHKVLVESFRKHANEWIYREDKNGNPSSDPRSNAELSILLDSLSSNLRAEADGEAVGEKLIRMTIANFPQLAPLLPRDLIWFYGNDGLHYLVDEEIRFFQQREEKFFEFDQNEEEFSVYLQAIEKIPLIPVDRSRVRQ